MIRDLKAFEAAVHSSFSPQLSHRSLQIIHYFPTKADYLASHHIPHLTFLTLQLQALSFLLQVVLATSMPPAARARHHPRFVWRLHGPCRF